MNIENDQYKIVDGNLIRCYECPGSLEFIPDGVTRIGNGAFVDCSVKIAEIPNCVKEIGDTAFHSCGPKKVVIHDGLEKMGFSPFFQWGESSIEEATVPLKFWHKFRLELKLSRLKKANLTGIGEALPACAFERCVKLEDITMPNSIKVIEYGAFDCCSSLKRIDLPSELIKIDGCAFRSCNSLEEIVLPSGVQKVGEKAFDGCVSLKKVKLNEGLTEIDKKAFEKCTSLEEIILPSSVQKIGESAFNGCVLLKKVKLNEGLIEISEDAFGKCTSLEEITIPGTIKKLKESAFCNCSSLKSAIFNEGLIEISKGAFANCNSLEEIILPSTTSVIENSAFYECLKLRKVKLNEGLTEIDDSAFNGCKSLEEIVIPNSINSIGNSVFSECSSLKKVVLPERIGEILNDRVFDGCTSLEKISISNLCNILFDNYNITIECLNIELIDISSIYKIINSFDIKNITFKCPKFSFLKNKEKEKLKIFIDGGYKISYEKEKDIKLNENREKDEDDIESIKNEIIYLSKNFPENITNIIVKNVNDIYNSYRNGIDNFKPEYGKDNGNLFDYESLKRNTYMKLFKIKNILNENKELVKFINEINECKKINDVRFYSPKNNIGDKISNIIYFSSFLNNNNEYKNSAFRCLDEELDIARGYLTDRLNDNSVIMDITILNQNLYKKIDEIFNKVLNDVKDIPKFKLTCLYNLVSGKEDINGIYENGIIYDISSIIEVINKLSDSVHKNKMKEELNTILNNNKDIISSSLNNNITEEEFNNIELKLRSDLSPLIEELDKYAKLDKYEDKDINIYRQIDMSFELINGIRDLDDELSNYRHNDVLLEVINIIKRVNEKEFNKDIREKVYSDVSNVLTAIKSLLSVTDISTKDKYIKFIAVATSLFGEVNSNIDKYIKSTNEYNSSFNIKK